MAAVGGHGIAICGNGAFVYDVAAREVISSAGFEHTVVRAIVEDLRRAAAHLADHYGPAELLIGHSLGGAAVLAAAADLPLIRRGRPHPSGSNVAVKWRSCAGWRAIR